MRQQTFFLKCESPLRIYIQKIWCNSEMQNTMFEFLIFHQIFSKFTRLHLACNFWLGIFLEVYSSSRRLKSYWLFDLKAFNKWITLKWTNQITHLTIANNQRERWLNSWEQFRGIIRELCAFTKGLSALSTLCPIFPLALFDDLILAQKNYAFCMKSFIFSEFIRRFQ